MKVPTLLYTFSRLIDLLERLEYKRKVIDRW